MKLGAVFPQLESGADPLAIRDYAQAVEGMGFNHLLYNRPYPNPKSWMV